MGKRHPAFSKVADDIMKDVGRALEDRLALVVANRRRLIRIAILDQVAVGLELNRDENRLASGFPARNGGLRPPLLRRWSARTPLLGFPLLLATRHEACRYTDIAEVWVLIYESSDLLRVRCQGQSKSKLASILASLPAGGHAYSPLALRGASRDADAIVLATRCHHCLIDFWEYVAIRVMRDDHLFLDIADELTEDIVPFTEGGSRLVVGQNRGNGRVAVLKDLRLCF
mmetsp:Transcript_37712/g.80135  ORF Transcript_37712/g.80135 Transcript_37712/m.80135 type:complete len:229 (-) Transcript_37712:80-766(-)